MAKITFKTPIVEMQGDEMTRILWDWIKEILIEPYVKLNTVFFDLGLDQREKTQDKVTHEAADAIKKYGVGVKCATITPNAQRVQEYNLSNMWISPNATIRAALDGTVFREPILVKGITPFIPSWVKPVAIARHAYGDIYKNRELAVDTCACERPCRCTPPCGCPSVKTAKAELVVTYSDGTQDRGIIADFDGCGIVQGVHNTDRSIASFARSCFKYGLSFKKDVWFATKDTISKTYDHRFKDIFETVFQNEYKADFDSAGIVYEYKLIDDAVAQIVRSSGGMLWALKNYDGDVMSDMVASVFGSLALMTSVLVSPDGKFEYEAAHGTVTRHYYRYREGGETSTNPVATIFAWTGALKKRGETDNNKDLSAFAARLEKATLDTVEAGFMTGDLTGLFKLDGIKPIKLSSRAFLEKIAQYL
ncbi:MAG: NADP-dependent isocitrate dehydrogenase [Firmicutes bacterium]|nr:NADP-dependent isocitrate dehydrogenase [Bacillota bacterium]